MSTDAADFGRYLTQQRELRGLSREHVANSTKIPLALVRALESGDLRKLPSRLYVVNFIRSYADVIGLGADEAVLRFEEVKDGAFPPEPDIEDAMRHMPATKIKVKTKESSRSRPSAGGGRPSSRVGVGLFVAFLLGMVALGGAYFWRKQQAVKVKRAAAAAMQTNGAPAPRK